jgi:thiamine biosynthesis lipoprotein
VTSAASARVAAEVHTETWEALGTTALLRYTGPANEALRAAVDGELGAIDLAASRFRDDSELARVNRAPGTRVEISPLLYEAIELALRAAELTAGVVDPTLGESLITLGYDRDWRELDTVDPRDPLTAASRIVVTRRRRPRWPEIELTERPRAVRLPFGTSLDLGATAKALAADRAACAAHRAAPEPASTGVLVSLGGDIATAGLAPAGGWTIHATDDHRAGPGAPGQTVAVCTGGLATSSLTTRRWRAAGTSHHHILDPRTGVSVTPVWRTVSVAAATCADANIASTAAIVLGADALDWLSEQGLPARLVALDGDVTAVNGWPS